MAVKKRSYHVSIETIETVHWEEKLPDFPRAIIKNIESEIETVYSGNYLDWIRDHIVTRKALL